MHIITPYPHVKTLLHEKSTLLVYFMTDCSFGIGQEGATNNHDYLTQVETTWMAIRIRTPLGISIQRTECCISVSYKVSKSLRELWSCSPLKVNTQRAALDGRQVAAFVSIRDVTPQSKGALRPVAHNSGGCQRFHSDYVIMHRGIR